MDTFSAVLMCLLNAGALGSDVPWLECPVCSPLTCSPVNILKDPPQIATEGFSMVLRPEGFLE